MVDIVAIVATHRGREELLMTRALPSIWAQIIRPRAVIVVDDDGRTKIELGNRRVYTTPNRGARHMSGTGCWNTGARDARAYLPHGGFLAFLDDDDAWCPGYLLECERAVGRATGAWPARVGMVASSLVYIDATGRERRMPPALLTARVGMVASGLVYIDATGRERRMPPRPLTADHFMTKRPAIHTSNLFVDIGAFEAIGGFDETLQSQTDRDFCVRLLGHMGDEGLAMGRVDGALVEYYAHDGPRVTNDAAAQAAGLAAFDAKHPGFDPKRVDTAGMTYEYWFEDSDPA